MMLLEKLREKLFGYVSRFAIGDTVQLEAGSEDLMVVTEIYSSRDLSEPLIACKWSVKGRAEIRTCLFPESKLKPFNWNKAF
jgi:hypothetical protein